MTGFLENLKAQVDTLTQEVAALKQALANTQQASSVGGALNIGGGTPAADPFGGLGGGAASTPANVTAEMITALIQPHLDNDGIKAQLGAAMREMGINALPETQQHQYAPLYAKFQQIIAGASAGTPSSASII